jgi:hypothetical protein
MTGSPGGYDFERFIGEYTIRVAIGCDYDEDFVEGVKSTSWEDTKRDWDGDYQFRSGREGAWIVDANRESLEAVREATGLEIPPADEITVAEPVIETNHEQLGIECPECGCDGVLSTTSLAKVFPRRGDRLQVVIDHPDATHGCYHCHAVIKSTSLKAHQVM